MTLKTLLKRALARIEDPKHWTRGAMARDAHGHVVSAQETRACKWCALGTLRAEPGVGEYQLIEARRAVESALAKYIVPEKLGTATVTRANDAPIKDGGAGHKGVVAAFRDAIKVAP